MVTGKSTEIVASLLSVLVSVLLSYFGIGFIFFPIPVLIMSIRLKKKSVSVFAALLMTFVVVLIKFFSGVSGFSAFVTVMFLQICISTVTYIALADFSNSILRKLVFSSIPGFIIGVLFFLFVLFSPTGKNVMDTASVQFAQLLEGIDEITGFPFRTVISNQTAVNLLLMNVSSIIVFLFSSACAGFSILMAEFSVGKRIQEKEAEFAYMKMPAGFFPVFLTFWVICLLSLFTDLFPEWFGLLYIGCCLWISLPYFVNGFSLFLYRIRKKRPGMTASSFLIITVLLMFIPAIGLIVFATFVLSGVFERWIKFR